MLALEPVQGAVVQYGRHLKGKRKILVKVLVWLIACSNEHVVQKFKVEIGMRRYAPVKLWRVLSKYHLGQMNTGHGRSLAA